MLACAEVADMLIADNYVDTGCYEAPRGLASFNAVNLSAKMHTYGIIVAQLQ